MTKRRGLAMSMVVDYFDNLGVPIEVTRALHPGRIPVDVQVKHAYGEVYVSHVAGGFDLGVVTCFSTARKDRRAVIGSTILRPSDGPGSPSVLGQPFDKLWRVVAARVQGWTRVPLPKALSECGENRFSAILRKGSADVVASLPEDICQSICRLDGHLAGSGDIWRLWIHDSGLRLWVGHMHRPSSKVVYGVPPDGDVIAFVDSFLGMARWRLAGNSWTSAQDS